MMPKDIRLHVIMNLHLTDQPVDIHTYTVYVTE